LNRNCSKLIPDRLSFLSFPDALQQAGQANGIFQKRPMPGVNNINSAFRLSFHMPFNAICLPNNTGGKACLLWHKSILHLWFIIHLTHTKTRKT
jgi:hypothetical protein